MANLFFVFNKKCMEQAFGVIMCKESYVIQMQKIFSYKDIVAALLAEFDLVKIYSNMVIMLKVL